MKTAITICSLGAVAAAMISLKLSWPDDAQTRYNLAHNEIERIAFREDGSAELQKAVTHERSADEELYVDRYLGRGMIWVSGGLSGAVFVLSLLAGKRKTAEGRS